MQGRNIYPRYHPYFHKRELSIYLTRIKRHMLLGFHTRSSCGNFKYFRHLKDLPADESFSLKE